MRQRRISAAKRRKGERFDSRLSWRNCPTRHYSEFLKLESAAKVKQTHGPPVALLDRRVILSNKNMRNLIYTYALIALAMAVPIAVGFIEIIAAPKVTAAVAILIARLIFCKVLIVFFIVVVALVILSIVPCKSLTASEIDKALSFDESFRTSNCRSSRRLLCKVVRFSQLLNRKLPNSTAIS